MTTIRSSSKISLSRLIEMKDNRRLQFSQEKSYFAMRIFLNGVLIPVITGRFRHAEHWQSFFLPRRGSLLTMR